MVTPKKHELIAHFDKCPICGGTERIGQSIYNELVKEGKAGDGLVIGSAVITGLINDPRMITKILIGSTSPTVNILLDVCANPECGCIYAVQVLKGEAKLESIHSGK